MQSALLIWVIYVNVGIRLIALARGVGSGLIRSHLVFTALLLLSLSRIAMSVMGRSHYLAYYNATIWPVALVEAGTVIEAFWILASHFRKIRGFGWTLVGAIAVIAALAAGAVGVIRANWTGYFSVEILFSMYTHVGFLIAALLSFAFFRQFRGVPIRRNAIRHIFALSIYFGLFFVSALIMNRSRTRAALPANLAVNIGGILSFGWWAIAMNRAGEELPFEPPGEIPRAEYEALEAAHRGEVAKLKQAGDQAMRKALREPEISPADHAAPPDPPEQAA